MYNISHSSQYLHITISLSIYLSLSLSFDLFIYRSLYLSYPLSLFLNDRTPYLSLLLSADISTSFLSSIPRTANNISNISLSISLYIALSISLTLSPSQWPHSLSLSATISWYIHFPSELNAPYSGCFTKTQGKFLYWSLQDTQHLSLSSINLPAWSSWQTDIPL